MDGIIPKTEDYFGDICHMKEPGLVILGNKIGDGLGKAISNNKDAVTRRPSIEF